MEKKINRRYEIREERGGSYRRYYVFDTEKGRIFKSRLDKYTAVGVEHTLNGRKFKKVLDAVSAAVETPPEAKE
jgi:hypothetical protein